MFNSGTAGTARKLAYLVEYLRIYWTDFRNLGLGFELGLGIGIGYMLGLYAGLSGTVVRC